MKNLSKKNIPFRSFANAQDDNKRIDGKAIAEEIFQKLKHQVILLKKKNITPHLAIILVGDNPASVSYVQRKKLKAEEIGAKVTVLNYELGIKNNELLKTIEQLNKENNVHGIIIQRPLPPHIDNELMNQAVTTSKDIDAFHKETPFEMPLAKAAIMLLEDVYSSCHPALDAGSSSLDSGSEAGMTRKKGMTFNEWLQSKKITVIGKGETGGGPIITLLKKYKINPTIIDSKTKNPKKLTKASDIIISAVGKQRVITSDMLTKGVILISVGQHREDDGKFHGDYEETNIQDIASCYSPTPGGVGPVNVACLLENLLQAASSSF